MIDSQLNLSFTVAPQKQTNSFFPIRSPKLSIFTKRMLQPTITVEDEDLIGGRSVISMASSKRNSTQSEPHYYLMMKPPRAFSETPTPMSRRR
jgi:hypothetical protein